MVPLYAASQFLLGQKFVEKLKSGPGRKSVARSYNSSTLQMTYHPVVHGQATPTESDDPSLLEHVGKKLDIPSNKVRMQRR